MPRRRPGVLLPLELDILEAGVRLQAADDAFHGFGLARELAGDDGAKLTAHGTLYKALSRMADAGLLDSEWEPIERADAEGRPRRRLYRVTADGARAAREQRAADAAVATAPRLGLA